MRILFYTPYDEPVNYIISLAVQFVKDGHDVSLLTQCTPGRLHHVLAEGHCKIIDRPHVENAIPQKIAVFTSVCRKYNFDIIYSHYQEANIVAVLSQVFIKTPIVITRHHSDCGFIDPNWKERMADRIINRLANYYISPSVFVTKQIREIEKATRPEVLQINYAYDFGLIPDPDMKKVAEIRNKFPARILLIAAARLIPEKRHLELLNYFQKLPESGIILLILGKGPCEKEIRDYIEKNGLTSSVKMLGFKNDIQNYYKAADLMVHFSHSEASNSAVKEAAIVNTPAVVCENVGDFSDYIMTGKTGFLLDRENPGPGFLKIMSDVLDNKYSLIEIGENVRKTVISKFSINKVIDNYYKLHDRLLEPTQK